MKTGIFIILFLGLFIFSAQATELNAPNDTTYIFLKDYGLYKTRKKNAIKQFYKALDDLKTDQPKILVFSTGTYHFYPDGCKTKVYYEANTTNENPKVCAFHFENIKNLVIDGRGSHLIFHQEMQPFTFDNCQNITLKNMTIDWEQPFIAQAEVLRVTEHYMDIGLDPRESPYRIVDGKIFFEIGNGQQNEWNSTLEFDRKGRFIVPQTGGTPCLGDHWNAYHAEPTMPGIVRLHFSFERKPQIGNYLVMSHAKASHAGVFIHESENVEVNNLRLYHAVGPGIMANHCKNLIIDRYQAIPNRSKNRYFSGLAEGLQLSGCIGEVVVKNSTFQGLTSDALVISNAIINKSTSESQAVKELKENGSHATEVAIKQNTFNSCRGSGIVLTSADKVQIQNNMFETSGSAVLIAGVSDTERQANGVSDVKVFDNTFNSYCNSSTYSLCEAIISVFPSIPKINEQSLPYHKNISIQNNRFYPFDIPLIYALSVDGLVFQNNTINKSSDISPFHDRQYNFSFEYCKNIKVTNNIFSDDIEGKNILLQKTPQNQLNTDLTHTFEIVRY
ncbi:right-handed parallel beta-helix repeat-containing protein [uncultured Draconibacterium sp.]|uniref:right-handed parallel beta-helix repeat-containing protein n=1 Tax=uncultured Draconibacterium sp. TaxID=1573823 RepID=UPI002AA7A4FB|nr:right-handed parallel beta-helix repeat-containing protein [uncultured Draconibacterium sp.]